MPPLTQFMPFSLSRPIIAAMFALALAGCAQQKTAGYYNTPHDNTESDAQHQAQGRNVARAPSQIQLGFGNEQHNKQAQGAPAQAPEEQAVRARALSEPKTFLGTVPCLINSNACSATRVTLTMAPGGQWRSRTVALDGPDTKNHLVQQGCWEVIGTQPLRILLQMKNDVIKANLTFVNDNVLRINMINEIKPTLEYHLTRQQDIDPIDELSGQPALQCQ
ncbi:hypothetical protein H0A66_10340 [Alcaligenaceae bacterium]|nr:hypothetical protein [Alcaligenaceae bacterium]